MTATDQPMPRTGDTITTAEQLDALPVGSVVLDVHRRAFQRFAFGWEATGLVGAHDVVARPTPVLYRPDAPHPAPVGGDAVERGARALAEATGAGALWGSPEQTPAWTEAEREERRGHFRAQVRLVLDAAALAAARAGEVEAHRLPDPKAGCVCTWHTQDAGGGYTETVIEYEPACPEHSKHLYDPRSGTWVLRAREAVDREALTAAIWNASRADEGTISATGAKHVADAVMRFLAAWGDAAPSDNERVMEQEMTRNIDGDYSLWRRTVTYGPWQEVRP